MTLGWRILKLIALAALWAALISAPYWMPYLGGYSALGTRVLVLGLGAMSVNFLLGFTGVLSFGHAAFFATAAYVTGYMVKQQGLGPGAGIVAGTLAAGALGFVIGNLVVRRQGIYFSMITLCGGISLLVYHFMAYRMEKRIPTRE